MPDIRKNRGAHPEDRKLFDNEQLPKLRTAVSELSWLLTRDYSMKGALKLVGDRYALNDRQRLAVSRAACSDQSKAQRAMTLLSAAEIAGAELIADGFNLIITAEAALSRGLLIRCRDDCVRDLSSVHGSYRAVNETDRAIRMIGDALEGLQTGSVVWLLDRPVSNSGRLAQRIRDIAQETGRKWTVELTFNPDPEMAAADRIVLTSDSQVLDQAAAWFNFNRYLLEKMLDDLWLIDLRW
jgi:hypothetical protein